MVLQCVGCTTVSFTSQSPVLPPSQCELWVGITASMLAGLYRNQELSCFPDAPVCSCVLYLLVKHSTHQKEALLSPCVVTLHRHNRGGGRGRMQIEGEGPVKWRSCSSDEIALFSFGGFCPSVLSPCTGNFNHVRGFTSAFLFVCI